MSKVADSLNSFGKYIVQQSKTNLTREGHNDTSDLYNSIKYDLRVSRKQNFELTISMNDYGDFIDKGVQGAKKKGKAKGSPYKFKTSKTMIPFNAIYPWIKRKRLQWRKPDGRFSTYKQTAWAYAKSIHAKGIESTKFFSTPFERAFKRLPDEIVEAYALDMDKFFESTRKNARI